VTAFREGAAPLAYMRAHTPAGACRPGRTPGPPFHGTALTLHTSVSVCGSP
jgi:hypothetical protein